MSDVINYTYGSMQGSIDDSNTALRYMQEASDAIDSAYAKLHGSGAYSGESCSALLQVNQQSSQQRSECIMTAGTLNNRAVDKMTETQHLDHQGANALLA